MLTGVLSQDWYFLSQQLRKTPAPSAKLQAQLLTSQQAFEKRQSAAPQIHFDDSLPIHAQVDEIAKLLDQHQVLIVVGETGSGKSTQLPKLCLKHGRGIAGQIAHTQPRRIAARSIASRLSEEIGSPMGKDVGYKVRFQDNISKNSYIKVLTDGMLLAESQNDRFLRQYDTIIIDEAHERSLNIDFLLGYMRWLLPKRPDLKLIITSATINSELFADAFDAPVINVSGRTYPVEVRYIDCLQAPQDNQPDLQPDRQPDNDSSDQTHFQLTAEQHQQYDDGHAMHRDIVKAITLLQNEGRGDTLVFMATEAEIKQAIQYCEKHAKIRATYLPLYARLPSAQQDAIFHPKTGQTRIIFCTNVAETSLTVPNIKYVIDSGRARLSRYSWRLRVQRLPIEAVSQASANQRSGRCGRTSDGIAIRLYEADDFEQRDAFTTPEIKRTNLASVILQMQLLNLGDIKQFPFIESPEQRLIKEGFKLLYEIKAVDANYRITTMGRQIARLPIDPKYGAMLIAAVDQGVSQEIAAITSALVNPDVRMDNRQAISVQSETGKDQSTQSLQSQLLATQQHSDFITLLQRWLWISQQQQQLSRSQFNKFLSRHQLSYLRWHQWQDTYTQLIRGLQTELKTKQNTQRRNSAKQSPTHTPVDDANKHDSALQSPDSNLVLHQPSQLIDKLLNLLEQKQPLHHPYYHAIHISLLMGLANNIAQLNKQDEGKQKKVSKGAKKRINYLGSNNKVVMVHPGSALHKTQTNWLMAAEIVDTSQLFARTVAKISPKWCLSTAAHLLRFEYSEPHWNIKLKQVRANERALLYGLTLQAGKAVNYSSIDPAVCRQVFIQRALVEGQLKENIGFLQHNRQLIREIQQEEAKTRRRDLLVSDEVIYQIYDQHLPTHIVNAKQLHSWTKRSAESDIKRLYLSREDIIQSDVSDHLLTGLPQHLMLDGQALKLSYVFELGADDDGISLHLPIHLAEQLTAARIDYLVPAMLAEKITALLRSLPKSERKKYVPIGPFAAACAEAIQADPERMNDNSLKQQVRRHMWRMTGTEPDVSAWKNIDFEPHLTMRLCLIDKKQRILMCSRDLDEIHAKAQQIIKEQVIAIEHSPDNKISVNGLDDVNISQHITLASGVKVWPGLSLQKDKASILIDWFETEEKANSAHQKGLTALVLQQHIAALKKVWKTHPEQQKLCLYYHSVDGCSELEKDLHWNSVRLAYQLPRVIDAATLTQAVKEGTEKVLETQATLLRQLVWILPHFHQLKSQIKSKQSLDQLDAVKDIHHQVAQLIYPHFLNYLKLEQLSHYPRYLKAISRRLEKLDFEAHKDRALRQQVNGWQSDYDELPEAKRYSEAGAAFFWLLQEYRVSLFAQELGTAQRVSEKALKTAWKEIN